MSKDIHIKSEQSHYLNINNSGTLNEQNLNFAKRTLLFDALRKHANKLVKHTQQYPEGDISRVDLSLDFVILDTKTYSKILKVLQNYPEDRIETLEKYINIEIKA